MTSHLLLSYLVSLPHSLAQCGTIAARIPFCTHLILQIYPWIIPQCFAPLAPSSSDCPQEDLLMIPPSNIYTVPCTSQWTIHCQWRAVQTTHTTRPYQHPSKSLMFKLTQMQAHQWASQLPSDMNGVLGLWLEIGEEIAGISHGPKPLASSSSLRQSSSALHL